MVRQLPSQTNRRTRRAPNADATPGPPLTSQPLLATILLSLLGGFFSYYTTWALLTPLLPEASPLQSFFPARTWAVRIPVGVLLGGIAVVLGFVGWQGLVEARRLEELDQAAEKVKAR
jgi:dolichyl-phosphate mannosyltransferase polypeptide 2 regulatory subunit